MIHAISHVDHGNRVSWFFNSMFACGSFAIVMVLSLAALWTTAARMIATLNPWSNGRNMSIQHIATLWTQHVATLWPSCYDMLGVVGLI